MTNDSNFLTISSGWASVGLGGLPQDLHWVPGCPVGGAREIPQPEEAPAAAGNEKVLRLHRRRRGLRVEEDDRQKLVVGNERRHDANAQLPVRGGRLCRHLRRVQTLARAARVSQCQEILTQKNKKDT